MYVMEFVSLHHFLSFLLASEDSCSTPILNYSLGGCCVPKLPFSLAFDGDRSLEFLKGDWRQGRETGNSLPSSVSYIPPLKVMSGGPLHTAAFPGFSICLLALPLQPKCGN